MGREGFSGLTMSGFAKCIDVSGQLNVPGEICFSRYTLTNGILHMKEWLVDIGLEIIDLRATSR